MQTRKSKKVPEVSEHFLRQVADRLRGIKQDREDMQKAVQEQASRKGQETEEVQVC